MVTPFNAAMLTMTVPTVISVVVVAAIMAIAMTIVAVIAGIGGARDTKRCDDQTGGGNHASEFHQLSFHPEIGLRDPMAHHHERNAERIRRLRYMPCRRSRRGQSIPSAWRYVSRIASSS